MKTTIELLNDGLERLSKKDNWCAFQRWKSDGTSCALGAINRALNPNITYFAYSKMTWKGIVEAFDKPAGDAIARLAEAAQMLNMENPVILPDWETSRIGPGLGFEASQCVAQFNNYGGWERTIDMFKLAIQLEQRHIDKTAEKLIESATQETADRQAVLSDVR